MSYHTVNPLKCSGIISSQQARWKSPLGQDCRFQLWNSDIFEKQPKNRHLARTAHLRLRINFF